MRITTLFAFAGAGSALIASAHSHAAYTGLTCELHTTITAPSGPKWVYRVYANFTNPSDLVFSFNGPTTDPMIIESRNELDTGPGSNFFNPGGTASNTAPTLAQINGTDKTPAIPNIQWGTYATIGVNIADQGSGPTPSFPDIDQTSLSPGFPTFISGNTFIAAGAVFAATQPGYPGGGQGTAGYDADGDLSLRVQLMQLTLNATDGPRGQVDLACQLGGSGQTITFEDQTFSGTFCPTPGAITLLGLAGMIGRRRRR
jgi:hypothetical protein